MLHLTLWILGRFFFNLLDPCLIATLWRNGWTNFHETFRICQVWHNKNVARLFHVWLDYCTVPMPGVASCLLATLRKNAWMDYDDIFRICRSWHTKQCGILSWWCDWHLGCKIYIYIAWIPVCKQHCRIMDGLIFMKFQDMDTSANSLDCFMHEETVSHSSN